MQNYMISEVSFLSVYCKIDEDEIMQREICATSSLDVSRLKWSSLWKLYKWIQDEDEDNNNNLKVSTHTREFHISCLECLVFWVVCITL